MLPCVADKFILIGFVPEIVAKDHVRHELKNTTSSTTIRPPSAAARGGGHGGGGHGGGGHGGGHGSGHSSGHSSHGGFSTAGRAGSAPGTLLKCH